MVFFFSKRAMHLYVGAQEEDPQPGLFQNLLRPDYGIPKPGARSMNIHSHKSYPCAPTEFVYSLKIR